MLSRNATPPNIIAADGIDIVIQTIINALYHNGIFFLISDMFLFFPKAGNTVTHEKIEVLNKDDGKLHIIDSSLLVK